MKKLLLLLIVLASLASCTTPGLAYTIDSVESNEPTTNTFRVVWESNQTNPFIEFSKRTMVNCKETNVVREIHREKEFIVTMENGQLFDLNIKRESTVSNPELYIAIYKGDELQYEQEVDTHGFMMSNFVDYKGDISCQPLN